MDKMKSSNRELATDSTSSDPSEHGRIEYLSPPEQVSMGDDWFDIASLDHFWMRRRFQVFCRLCRQVDRQKWVEIGCGHGVVQRQFEHQFNLSLDGIDLNEIALKKNVSELSKVYCYNIFDRHPVMDGQYDAAILFDVIEHIDDDEEFVANALKLLQPDGMMVINVPAFMHMKSSYDDAAGHVRRYTIEGIRRIAAAHDLEIELWTYWGLPLTLLAWARRVRLAIGNPESIIRSGFEVRSNLLNQALLAWAQLELIPQRIYGTSLMAVLTKR